jgi:hypothetical protein
VSNSSSATGKSPATSSAVSSGTAVVDNAGSGSSVVPSPGMTASGRKKKKEKKKKNPSKKRGDGSQPRISTAAGDNTDASVPHQTSPKDRSPAKVEVSAYCQMLNDWLSCKIVFANSSKRLGLIVCYPDLQYSCTTVYLLPSAGSRRL